jgi:hypothetical protein
MGASVRARLLAVSKANGQVIDLVLNRYAVERLLYRLSVSAPSGRNLCPHGRYHRRRG